MGERRGWSGKGCLEGVKVTESTLCARGADLDVAGGEDFGIDAEVDLIENRESFEETRVGGEVIWEVAELLLEARGECASFGETGWEAAGRCGLSPLLDGSTV